MDADKKMKEIRKISENASEWYDAHLKETLDKKLDDIEAIFKELAANYAPAYHLVHQNESSKEIKLWLISSRVKGASSLAEKIIRGQQFYDLDLSTDETSEATILANNDDLIGLRYLVSLSCDCASVFQMICDHYDELTAKNITFSNLKSNPEIMHNGREIYRLKGRYEDKYPFELQIKSKIDSAWADEEHMLFYKESRYSYIQKSQRAIMNQVGELLDQADKLMCLIRHSHDEYTPDEIRESEFYQKLENRYAPVLREAISNTILLKQYRTAFYYYFNVWGEKSRKSFLRRMTEEDPLTSINSFTVDEDVKKSLLWKNYEAMKESCLEFILAEHISGDWLSSTPPLNEPLTFRRLCAYIVKMTEC
ncbi:MAG: hypothetical protein KBT01_05200, partial [Clostridiales bacterium]|nr:hypothetical protein [Candidatus Blautia equi]